MIIHRALRDIERCKIKYGEAWEEYERRVPYIFVPVSVSDDLEIQADFLLVRFLSKNTLYNYALIQNPINHRLY